MDQIHRSCLSVIIQRATMKTKRVVITGVGAKTNLGASLPDALSLWRAGRYSFEAFPSSTFIDQKFLAGFCRQEDVSKLPDRKIQKVTTRKDRLGLLALLGAVDSAKSSGFWNVVPERMGIFVGAASTQMSDLAPYVPLLRECFDPLRDEVDLEKFGSMLLGKVNPMVMMQSLMNNILCYASIHLDARGPNRNFVDFQSAGMQAVMAGADSILDGFCDVAVVGGAGSTPDAAQLSEGVRLKLLTATGEGEKARVRPYSKDATGTIISEGAAFLVLEERESAIHRGANILAEVYGYACCHDGSLGPSSEGLEKAIRRSCFDAGISTSEISLMMGHGSGIFDFDRMETSAYQNIPSGFAVHTPKFAFGETGEASGVLATVCGLDVLESKCIPLCQEEDDGSWDREILGNLHHTQDFKSGMICIHTRSFNGINAAMVIGPGDL